MISSESPPVKKSHKRFESRSSFVTYQCDIQDDDDGENQVGDNLQQYSSKSNNRWKIERFPVFPAWTEMSPVQVERQRIIYELIETEKLFILDISLLVKSKFPKIVKSRILTADESVLLEKFISPLWDILAVHERLLSAMLSERVNYCVSKISEPLLPIYSSIINPYVHLVANLDNFLSFINNMETKYGKPLRKIIYDGAQSVSEILRRPILRLIRYDIYFKSILSHSSPDHVDYDNTKILLGEIKSILDRINDVKDFLARVQELKTFERQMSFRHAVSIDGRKKQMPKFHFQVYRDDFSRYVVRQDRFFRVTPSKSKGDKGPFSLTDKIVHLFLTNDLFFIGTEMSAAEKKREGKKWKMFHEPVTLSLVKMEILPPFVKQTSKGSHTAKETYHWCKLVFEPGETYYLSANVSQIEYWANRLNVVPNTHQNLDKMDKEKSLQQKQEKRGLSRRSSIVKEYFSGFKLFPSRPGSATPGKTQQRYESTALAKNEEIENAVAASDVMEKISTSEYKIPCSAFFWNYNIQKSQWDKIGRCEVIISRDGYHVFILLTEVESSEVLFKCQIYSDTKISLEDRNNINSSSSGSREKSINGTPSNSNDKRRNSIIAKRERSIMTLKMIHFLDNKEKTVLLKMDKKESENFINEVNKAKEECFDHKLSRRLADLSKDSVVLDKSNERNTSRFNYVNDNGSQEQLRQEVKEVVGVIIDEAAQKSQKIEENNLSSIQRLRNIIDRWHARQIANPQPFSGLESEYQTVIEILKSFE